MWSRLTDSSKSRCRPVDSRGLDALYSAADRPPGQRTIRLALVTIPCSCARTMPSFTDGVRPKSSAVTISVRMSSTTAGRLPQQNLVLAHILGTVRDQADQLEARGERLLDVAARVKRSAGVRPGHLGLR